MNEQTNDDTTQKLLTEMKSVITRRLWDALNHPTKPPKASTISAAIQWTRVCGAVEDPDARFRPRPLDPAFVDSMPFLTDADKAQLRQERERLAASVQHAVETMAEEADDDESDF